MAKAKRATDALMLELTKIDTCLSIGHQYLEKLPEIDAKRALTKMVEEGRAAVERATASIQTIRTAADAI